MEKFKNKQSGFLTIIVIIVVAIIVLSFLHIKISDVVNYIIAAFHNVFG